MKKKIARVVVLACLTASCSASKATAPTPTPLVAPSSLQFGASIQPAIAPDVTISDFARCLQAADQMGCFAGARLHVTAIGSALVAAPGGLVAMASGSAVTLTWGAQAGTAVAAYIIEAGSAPGLANLANFSTGNAQTSFSATGIGSGTYYVRVRAVGTTGEISAPSNEAVLVVGSACAGAPSAPDGLVVVSVVGSTVVLAWSPALGGPTSYIVEAGSSPGLANLANSDLGLTTSLTATGVGAGTYYVRIRAKNICGVGGPSNEAVLTVAGAPPTPAPSASFGPGQYLIGRDIPAGRYYSVPVSGCYWERESGLSGSLSDILANDFIGFNPAQWIVDILPNDVAFKTEAACGRWFTTPRQGPQANVPPGMWLIGAQVSPGTYRTTAQSGCYWERLRDFSGNLSGILDNDFVSSAGQQLVAIGAGDTGFDSNAACGTWSRVGALTTALQTQSPTDVERQWMNHRSRNAGLISRGKSF